MRHPDELDYPGRLGCPDHVLACLQVERTVLRIDEHPVVTNVSCKLHEARCGVIDEQPEEWASLRQPLPESLPQRNRGATVAKVRPSRCKACSYALGFSRRRRSELRSPLQISSTGPRMRISPCSSIEMRSCPPGIEIVMSWSTSPLW